MRIRYTRQSKRWLSQYFVDINKLTDCIERLCNKEGGSRRCITIHIMPKAINSDYEFWLDRLNVAVESHASRPRHFKLRKMCRNLLHELRHFIQYRIKHKPFAFTYSYRDAALLNSRYWNDPDEIDARNYEKRKLNFLYKKLI